MKIIFILCMAGLFSSCHTSQYRIQGKTEGMKSPNIELLTLNDSVVQSILLDTTGSFDIKGTIDSAGIYYLQWKKDYLKIPIWLENGEYTLVKGDGTYYLTNKNTEAIQNQWSKFLQRQREVEKEYEAMGIQYCSEGISMDEKVRLSEKMDILFDKRLLLLMQGLEEFNHTAVSYHIVMKEMLFLEHDYNYFTRVMSILEKNDANSPLKKSIIDKYTTLKNSQLSGPAPDFELPDTQGNKITLSSFRGKYVLVDFWASWCAPCRKKNKELNKLYPDLKDAGLTIISVSLDDEKSKWLEAVQKDKIEWIQLVDLNGFQNSSIREAYKVKQVPTVFLINPQGNIVKTNPEFEDIQNALQTTK